MIAMLAHDEAPLAVDQNASIIHSPLTTVSPGVVICGVRAEAPAAGEHSPSTLSLFIQSLVVMQERTLTSPSFIH